MEYNSFYGGRRGASFIIVKSFKTEAEMAAAFRQGGNYKTVNYDEYVIIDTENKNNKDNGKIYRRGYNYANDPNNLGGAEYIGQIVGPAGLAPHAELGTIEKVQQEYNRAEEDHLDYRHGNGSYTLSNTSLVPGKSNGVYNDNITWEYCSVRDEHQTDTIVYVGFKIPYLVVEYITTGVEPYNASGNYADMSAITRIDDETHPFYEQWRLSIPKGIKGDTLKNFKLFTPTTAITMKDANGNDHALAANKTVLVYDYIKYDNKQAGEVATLYLGEYDLIDDISLANDGTITITYTGNKATDTFNKALKYITKVELTAAGQFTVTYNNDRTLNGQGQTYTTTLKWVTGLMVNSDGSVTVSYNNGNPTTTARNLQWVENLRIDTTNGANNGKIYRKYSTEDNETQIAQLKYIKDTDMSADGHITYTYNDNTTKVDDTQIKYVKDIAMAADGTLTSTDNTNTSKTLGQIKYVKDVDMATNGTITYTYNDNTTKIDDTQIKYINDVSIAADGTIKSTDNAGTEKTLDKLTYVKNINMSNAGEITYTYNDDTTSVDDTQIKYINDITIANNGTVTYKNNAGETAKTQANRIRWVTGSTYNANTGILTFSYNYGTADTYTYKYINDVTLTDAGVFTVKDNTGTTMMTKILEYPKTVELVNGHTLKITANTGTVLLQEELKWVDNIDIYQDKFRLHYNDNTTSVLNDVLLNQIDDMTIPTSGTYAYHLLVYYTATSKRGNINYNNKTGWSDLGQIKDYNGILIGTNIAKSTDPTLNTITGCLTYLNTNYPNGITSGYSAGKIVTIGDNESDKGFYAYDYTNNEWIYLGTINSSAINPSVIVGDSSVASRAAQLPTGSLWFIVEGE